MRVLIFNCKDFERPELLKANNNVHQLSLVSEPLNETTALLAKGYEVVVIATGDDASAPVIQQLHRMGVHYIAIRATGFDNIDINKAGESGIAVANVPGYSSHAVAEHSIALILALNRKIPLSQLQVHSNNFSVNNLFGFELYGKTVGIIGTGKIGRAAAAILHGFGCILLGYDIIEDRDLTEKYHLRYVDLATLCRNSDIISLYISLGAPTRNLVNKNLLDQMKPGAMLINTARGGLINTRDVMESLKTGHLGYLGMDVYENEKDLFFYDRSAGPVRDELLKELLSFPNVLITPHQGFATREALETMAVTTFYNINCWAGRKPTENELTHINTHQWF